MFNKLMIALFLTATMQAIAGVGGKLCLSGSGFGVARIDFEDSWTATKTIGAHSVGCAFLEEGNEARLKCDNTVEVYDILNNGNTLVGPRGPYPVIWRCH